MGLPYFRIFLAAKSDQHSQQATDERDGDVKNNKAYPNITVNLYPLVYVRRSPDRSYC